MQGDTELNVTHIRPTQGAGVLNPQDVWEYRLLLYQMVIRNFRSRVQTSPMSLVWGFIRPAIMTLAFIYIRHASNADFGSTVPYALFIFSGLCIWFLFSEIAIQVAGSISADANLSQKVYFPKILSPLAIVLSRWIDLIAITAAVLVVQLFFQVYPDWKIVLLLPAYLSLMFLAFGLGCLFAGLMLVHPDTRKFLETMLYLGLFLSPVLFSKSILPPFIQDFFVLNPVVGVLSAIRGSLFGPDTIDYFAWGVSLAISVVLAAVGMLTLAWAARKYGDRV
jgi:lipopolysaccharide transport system permease protein